MFAPSLQKPCIATDSINSEATSSWVSVTPSVLRSTDLHIKQRAALGSARKNASVQYASTKSVSALRWSKTIKRPLQRHTSKVESCRGVCTTALARGSFVNLKPRFHHILVLVHDTRMRNLLRTRYEVLGYRVVAVKEMDETISVMQAQSPDLIVIDSDADVCDARLVMQQLQRVDKKPRFLLLLTPEEVPDFPSELAPAHFVVKPFTPQEVEARTETALMSRPGEIPARGRAEGAPSRITHVVVGKRIIINVDVRLVYRDGAKVPMTTMQYELLKRIALNADETGPSTEAVSSRELAEHIHRLQCEARDRFDGGRARAQGETDTAHSGPPSVSIKAIGVHIHRLRGKLEDDPKKPELLLTKYNRDTREHGYVLSTIDRVIESPVIPDQ